MLYACSLCAPPSRRPFTLLLSCQLTALAKENNMFVTLPHRPLLLRPHHLLNMRSSLVPLPSE
jgi:hypothetical protein